MRSTQIVICALALIPPASIAGGIDKALSEPFPYIASDLSIDRVVEDIRKMAGIAIISHGDIDGNLSISNPDGTVADVLSAIENQTNVVWWFDGSSVRLEPRSALASSLIPLGEVTAYELDQELKSLNLEDDRFPVWPSVSGDFVRLVAPEGYVQEAEKVVTYLNASKSPKGCVQGNDASGESANRTGSCWPVVLRGGNVGSITQ